MYVPNEVYFRVNCFIIEMIELILPKGLSTYHSTKEFEKDDQCNEESRKKKNYKFITRVVFYTTYIYSYVIMIRFSLFLWTTSSEVHSTEAPSIVPSGTSIGLKHILFPSGLYMSISAARFHCNYRIFVHAFMLLVRAKWHRTRVERRLLRFLRMRPERVVAIPPISIDNSALTSYAYYELEQDRRLEVWRKLSFLFGLCCSICVLYLSFCSAVMIIEYPRHARFNYLLLFIHVADNATAILMPLLNLSILGLLFAIHHFDLLVQWKSVHNDLCKALRDTQRTRWRLVHGYHSDLNCSSALSDATPARNVATVRAQDYAMCEQLHRTRLRLHRYLLYVHSNDQMISVINGIVSVAFAVTVLTAWTFYKRLDHHTGTVLAQMVLVRCAVSIAVGLVIGISSCEASDRNRLLYSTICSIMAGDPRKLDWLNIIKAWYMPRLCCSLTAFGLFNMSYGACLQLIIWVVSGIYIIEVS